MIDELNDAWADPESSRQIPIFRAQGEGQSLEFMKEFPANTRELAKEIPAFATSNSGTILIGVDNSGECVGLSNVVAAVDRDSLLRRVEGICHGPVKPSITPRATFVQEAGRTVLMLTIPKGSQPVYYANGVPYLRHITSSRPAEPHEVIELIQGTLTLLSSAKESIEEVPDRRVHFLAELMRELVGIKIVGEEFADRMINPWLERVRAQCADSASRLREWAAQPAALEERLDGMLLVAAGALESVAKVRLHLGSGPELSRLGAKAFENVQHLLKHIEPDVIRHVSPQQLMEQLGIIRRQLATLDAVADQTRVVGGVEELQAQAAELGRKILFAAHYGVDRLAADLGPALLRSGHELQLAETQRLYLDGGLSVGHVIDGIKEAIAGYNTATAPVIQS